MASRAPSNRLGLAEVAGRSGEPADGPGGGQPPLADALRHRAGQDGRGLRRPGRAAQPSRAARLAGDRVRFARAGTSRRCSGLIVTSATLPAVVANVPGAARPRSREPPAARGATAPAAGRDDPRPGAGLGGLLVERLGGPSVKPYQPPGLWNELADAELRPGPRSRASIAAASTRSGSGRSPRPSMVAFDAPGRETCIVREVADQHAAPGARPAERRDLRRGRPGPGRADHRRRRDKTPKRRLAAAFRAATGDGRPVPRSWRSCSPDFADQPAPVPQRPERRREP